MTNYRLTMCAYHDKPQWNFCFDCGARLVQRSYPDGLVWVCPRNEFHVHIFAEDRRHKDPDNDSCKEIVFQ
jgi:hypothetical protein